MPNTKNRSRMKASDRERIATAFGELVERGYLLPFAGWEVCCTNCGWAEVAKQIGISEDDEVDELPADLKTVWWHEQSDSYAFCMDGGAMPQTEEFLESIPEDADFEEWFDEHGEEIEADSILARTTEYTMLLEPLYIHWRGDKHEIVAALRAQGLRVMAPPSDGKCIVVLPDHSTFHADPVNGEVVLHLDGDETVLTIKDARRLARALNRAVKGAQGQVPTL